MSEAIERGALYIVATPIGNLEDISRRAVTILGGVDLIAAEDTRTSGVLLAHLGIKKPMVSFHSYNEQRRSGELIDRLRSGESVAVITDAGTPAVSDPAFSLVRAAVEAGIRVIPIPGASAVLAALVASGLPTDRFAFEGFLPVKKGRATRLRFLKDEPRTIVLYEAPHRIEKTLNDLLAALGRRPAALARELTKKFEEIRRGDLGELLEGVRQKPPKGEMVIVVQGANGRTTSKELCNDEDSIDTDEADGDATSGTV
jgi:16S rRNA (cytidine1402-2'-O)-methyltransferase